MKPASYLTRDASPHRMGQFPCHPGHEKRHLDRCLFFTFMCSKCLFTVQDDPVITLYFIHACERHECVGESCVLSS